MDGIFVAIKMNFGETGEHQLYAPHYAGGCGCGEGAWRQAFLTDCNNLYPAEEDALEQLFCSWENGLRRCPRLPDPDCDA
jgi:hypothetical protein